MANTELVDVEHPDVGLSRVPKRSVHLYERQGWKQISPDTAAKKRANDEKKAGTASTTTDSNKGS